MHDGVDGGVYEDEGNAADQKIKAEVERFLLGHFSKKIMHENPDTSAKGIIDDIDIGKAPDAVDNLKDFEGRADQSACDTGEKIRMLFE